MRPVARRRARFVETLVVAGVIGSLVAVAWHGAPRATGGDRSWLSATGRKPLDVLATPSPLTPRQARAALAEAARSEPRREPFRSFDPDGLARAPIERSGDGPCAVGGFRVDLRRARYETEIGHKCHFHYTGSFAWRQGRWVATPPPGWDWVACSK